MNVGDLVLQAFLSVLIGAMVYFWFLAACIIPHGLTMATAMENIEAVNQQVTPP